MMRYTITPDRIVFGPELFKMNFMHGFKCPLFEKSHHSKIWTVEKKTTMILLPISLISIKVYPKRTHSSHNENHANTGNFLNNYKHHPKKKSSYLILLRNG